MRNISTLPLLFTLLLSCGSLTVTNEQSQPPNHIPFDKLLKQYVNDRGLVNYEGLAKDRGSLKSYLETLSANGPNDKWSRNEKLAYWINAYNAFTLELILTHYPVNSIKDIGSAIKIPFVNTPWDIKFIKIAGEELDLNNIEHGIIRKQFDEPRIHFALVCAAISCPKLRNEAYLPEKLDQQLDAAAKDFLREENKNKFFGPDRAELSKLFSWYKGDFKDGQSVIQFLNKYAPIQLQERASLDYKDYDWALNKQ